MLLDFPIFQGKSNYWNSILNFPQLLTETVSKERELLAKRIHELEGDLKEMEETTDRLRQEQRLLLEYPDLNGPVNNTGSGDSNFECCSSLLLLRTKSLNSFRRGKRPGTDELSGESQ